jgi:hypothetical protein
MSPTRSEDWIDDDEYPDDADMAEFGESSPVDYDRRTMGKVRHRQNRYWTRGRIVIAVISAALLLLMLLAELQPLLSQ